MYCKCLVTSAFMLNADELPLECLPSEGILAGNSTPMVCENSQLLANLLGGAGHQRHGYLLDTLWFLKG